MDKYNYKLASAIDRNNEDEYVAQSGYNKLLAEFEKELDPEDIDTIREIIADESNHSTKLAAMKIKYTGIKPTPDGLPKALSAYEANKQRYANPKT